MRKSLWSPDEDEKLRRYVAMHGCGNWSEVAKHTGLQRCGKSCRLRWINYLRPDLKRGPFSADEVRLVINLHHNLGNSWSKIATYLPGRTDNDVKNFWHSYTRSRRMPQHSDHRSHNNMQASTELAKRPKKPASATTINKVGLAANYKGISSGSQQTKCRIDENTSPTSQQKNCDYPHNCEYNQLPLAQVAKNHRINPKHIMQFGHESLVSPLPECTELQAASINETPFTFPLSEACDINTLSYDEMAQVARSLINPLISLKPPLTSTLKPPILCNPSYSSASFDLEEKPPEGLQSVIWSFLNRQLAPASSDHTVNQQVEPDHVLINHNINEAFAYANLQYSSPAQLADCFS